MASQKRSANAAASLRRFRPLPALREAAFDFKTNMPVAGSSPELVTTLENVVGVSSTHAHFTLPGDPDTPALGFVGPHLTPYGRFQIAIYQAKFRSDDIFLSMREDLVALAAFFITAALLSGATAWIAIQQGLTPVDSASAALRRKGGAELRTPLAIIQARLENAKASSFKSVLLGDASQPHSIVEEMLVAAKLTEGRAPLDQRVDLSEAARRIVSDLLPLEIDRDQFIDCECFGLVVVRIDCDEVVAIIDHGEGVFDADREMVFEPFWRKTNPVLAPDLASRSPWKSWTRASVACRSMTRTGGGPTFKLALPLEGSI
jgi:signal transduction histidine kinase